MKNVALLSAFDVKNYGSMLQSYAIQQLLKRAGCNNKIVYYKEKNIKKQFLRIFDKTLLKAKLNFIYRDFYGKFLDKDLGTYFENRDIVFDTFVSQYLELTDFIPNRKDLSNKIKEYDIVLVGSDQVWNPTLLKKDFYTMTFVPDEITKVAYSSSFGVASIPDNQKKVTANYLSRFNHIGVRELSGQKIIKELIGRDVPVVADPTILLSIDQWETLIDKKPLIDEEYIFCYFLGSNSMHRDFVRKLRLASGCKIVTIPHCDGIVKADIGFGDSSPQGIGPREFLNLVKNAKYVCTDSFHCCVFSILFARNFFVFSRFKENANKRASTNSRIHSFLQIANLSDRLVNEGAEPTPDMLTNIDYRSTMLRIEELRSRSFDYLYESLGISRE